MDPKNDMIDLQVVIVNFNVRHYLHQCLDSVLKSKGNIKYELWVVDNNSVDDSIQMLHNYFPHAKIIENKDNRGFAVANNQAIGQSDSRYVLLLNPDTLVSEDTFEKCIKMLDSNSEIGALGVKMIDGSGKFLPESKRGLPTPWIAIAKTFRLHHIFPTKALFNGYYLGHLGQNNMEEVDVLSGAFMMIRREVLNKIGLLDEKFFMYGEDIDLSYRILLSGYKNVYFPHTQIVHYKGESTKKGSLNYLITFYKAMILFAQKHYNQRKASLYISIIKLGIVLHAILSFTKRQLHKYLLAIVDFVLIYLGMGTLTRLWGHLRYDSPDYYASNIYTQILPLFTLIWLIALLLGTAYDKKMDLYKIFRSLIFWSISLLAIYSLLSLEYRYSRISLVLSSCFVLLYSLLSRNILNSLGSRTWKEGAQKIKAVLVIGSENEIHKVTRILHKLEHSMNIHKIIPKQDSNKLLRLAEYCKVERISEIIFCAENLEASQITKWMSVLPSDIQFKIITGSSMSIVGSPSKNRTGELYTLDIAFAIETEENKRNKWIFDKMLSIICIIFSPLLFVISRNRISLLSNSLKVLFGKKTWIGYRYDPSENLPRLKSPIFTCYQADEDPRQKYAISLAYARDYNWLLDMEMIWKKL